MSVSPKRLRDKIGIYFNWPGHPERVNQALDYDYSTANWRIVKRDIIPEIKDEIAHQNWKALHERFPAIEDFRIRLGGAGLKMSNLFDAMEQDWRDKGRRSLNDLIIKAAEVRDRFGEKFVCEVTAEMIEAFVTELRGRVGPATANRKLAIIRRAFNFAVKNKRIKADDVPAIRDNFEEPIARQTRYIEPHVEALYRQLPERLKRGVKLASITGWRLSEIFSRRKSHIHWDRNVLHLDRSKNGEKRNFPLTQEVRALLEDQLEFVRRLEVKLSTDRGQLVSIPWLFPNDDPRHPLGDQILRFDKAYRRACDQLELNIDPDTGTQRVHPQTGKPMNRWFHDWRRYASDRMEEKGLSDLEIMDAIGHKTLSMRRRYRGEVTAARIATIGAKLDAAATGRSVPLASKVVEFVQHACNKEGERS